MAVRRRRSHRREPPPLLVTFCNSSASPGSSLALFDVATENVRVVPLSLEPEDEGATGIAQGDDGPIFVALPGSRRIVQLDQGLRMRSAHQHDQLLDLHSMAVVGDTLYVVASGTDTVLEYDARKLDSGPQLAHAITRSGTDSMHVNSVCVHGGQVMITAFGNDWRKHAPDLRGGSVMGLDGSDVVSPAIRHPHSLTSTGEALYVLGSGTGTVERVLAKGGREVCARYPGYLRGLAVHPGGAVVGVSGRRRRSRGLGTLNTESSDYEARCLILHFDTTWNLTGTVDVSWLGREIYDIRLAPSGTHPPTHEDTLRAAKGRISELEESWESR